MSKIVKITQCDDLDFIGLIGHFTDSWLEFLKLTGTNMAYPNVIDRKIFGIVGRDMWYKVELTDIGTGIDRKFLNIECCTVEIVMRELKFEELHQGMAVYDSDKNECIVKDCENIHSVIVTCDGNDHLHCLCETCLEYYPLYTEITEL